MKYTLILLLPILLGAKEYTIDFGEDCSNCDWYVVLDGVMGGLSQGKAIYKENSILFKGTVSLENNGGFASLRTPYQNYDLSPFKKVVIRYKSVGQDFGLTLHKYRQFWRPQYKVNLPITNDDWETVTFNLKGFGTYRLGNKMEGSPTRDDLSEIIRLGLISNTKAATAFEIEIDYISFE